MEINITDVTKWLYKNYFYIIITKTFKNAKLTLIKKKIIQNYKNYFYTKITLIISLESDFTKDLTEMITLQIALLGSHNIIYMHILVTISDMLKFQNHLLLGVLQKISSLNWQKHLKKYLRSSISKIAEWSRKKRCYTEQFFRKAIA